MRKLVQRQVFSFLGTRWGVGLCLLGVFFTVNSIIHFSYQFIGSGRASCSDAFVDNIGGRSYEGALCAPVPIDIVYTWVNGSDPELQEAIVYWKEIHKRDHPDAFRVPPPPPPSPPPRGRRAQQAAAAAAAAAAANATAASGTHTADSNTTHAASSNGTVNGTGHHAGGAASARFRDNNELRYSLRSIEKFAPWVRNIYLVTNGQVPNWLDLSNPRIKVVPHEDIFLNKSHLPTFSSPAIEVHLHRIPGLSETFIYLNDDVMFGSEVWPDDFVSKADGQKVYLSWAVPNCNDGCPSTWINDGVCDAACNVSSCDFDGRDCVNVTSTTRHSSWWAGGNTSGGAASANRQWANRFSAYCAPGCPDSWIGDRYCDKACSNEACGWDATDCGLDVMEETLFGVNASLHLPLVHVPRLAPAMFVNLSSIFGHGHVLEGSHDNPDIVRTATISQKNKVMTLTFKRNVTEQLVSIAISGRLGDGDSGPVIEIVFNMTVDTYVPYEAPSPAPQDPLLASGPPEGGPEGDAEEEEEEEAAGDEAADGGEGGEEAEGEGEGEEAEAAAEGEVGFDDAGNSAGAEEEAAERDDDGGMRAAIDVPSPHAPPEAAEHAAETEEDHVTHDAEKPTIPAAEAKDASMGRRHSMRKLAAASAAPARAATARRGRRPRTARTAAAAAPAAAADRRRHWASVTLRPAEALFDAGTERCLVDATLGRRRGGASPCFVVAGDREFYDWISATKAKAMAHEEEEARHELVRGAAEHAHEHQLADSMMRSTRSPFPWERSQSLLSRLWLGGDEGVAASPGAAEAHGAARGGAGRRLLDLFGDSLKYVNRLFNRVFKQMARKVPAHMPHMINSAVMRRLQARFPVEFNLTSSHRFRDSSDMQYSFSYFYFLMQEPVELELRAYFDTLVDSDGSGLIDDNELRSLVARTLLLPMSKKDLREAAALLNATSHRVHGPTQSAIRDFATFAACEGIVSRVKTTMATVPRSKFSLAPLTQVAFQMIGSNVTDVNRALDEIRRDRHKFVCLNDDMGDGNVTAVVAALQDFYHALLPNASQFELPPGTLNKYLHINAFREAARQTRAVKAFGIALTATILLAWCWLYGPLGSAGDDEPSARRRRMVAV